MAAMLGLWKVTAMWLCLGSFPLLGWWTGEAQECGFRSISGAPGDRRRGRGCGMSVLAATGQGEPSIPLELSQVEQSLAEAKWHRCDSWSLCLQPPSQDNNILT